MVCVQDLVQAGTPPTQQQVLEAFNREQSAESIRGSRAAGSRGGERAGGVNARPTQAKFREFSKAFVINWDSKFRIYASRDSFQIQPWVTGNELEEPHLFQGFIDTWIQADIVTAIGHVNGTTHNVLSTPIKRIELIAIGATAEAQTAIGTPQFPVTQANGALAAGGGGVRGAGTASGPLFISMTGAGAAGPAGSQHGSGGRRRRWTGYKKSMTGRSVSDLYDVTHVRGGVAHESGGAQPVPFGVVQAEQFLHADQCEHAGGRSAGGGGERLSVWADADDAGGTGAGGGVLSELAGAADAGHEHPECDWIEACGSRWSGSGRSWRWT